MTDPSDCGTSPRQGPLTAIADPQTRIQFLRFVVIGILNTAFAYLVFAALMLAGIGSVAALLASAAASIAFNFQTISRLVFRSSGRMWRFVAIYAALLAIDWAALREFSVIGVPEIWAQAGLALPIAIASFVLQKLLVFDLPHGHPPPGKPRERG